MRELLRVFVLLKKFGPRKILKLIEEAEKDFLTNVYNRRGFLLRAEEEAERAVRGGGLFSLVFIDVDGLKKINDNHGHKEGDKHLHNIALVIKSRVRKIDIIGRWGGDEFVVLLPQVDKKDANIAAERICEDLGLSWGISSFREGASLGKIIREADEEMYKKRKK